MKEGWKVKKLKEVFDILNGYAFKSENYVESGLRIIRISNVQNGYIDDKEPEYYPIETSDGLANYLLREKDLLMSLTGNVGRVGFLPKNLLPAALNQRVACLRPISKKDINLNFFFYLFRSTKFLNDCLESARGVAQPNLSTTWLSKYPIPVPPLPEQERIVGRLDELFAHLDALQQNTQRAIDSAKELFQSKLQQAMTPKDGWKQETMGNFFDITSSKRVFQADWKSEGVPFYRAREIVKIAKQGYVNNELFISEDMYNEYSTKYGVPKAGDILITGVGTLGICYIVKENDRFYFKDGNIIWLKKKREINSRFVEYAYKTDYIVNQVNSGSGATVGTYTIVRAKDTKIFVPSIEEQGRIVEELDALSKEIEQLQANFERQAARVEELKQSILHEAFEGNL